MPIRPQFRWFYPIDWRELSAVIRFERAKGTCERCRRPHGKTVLHLGDGRWWDEDRQSWRNGRGRLIRSLPSPAVLSLPPATTRVVLAAAHLDHDPTNNRPRNLRALCQRCHMIHDRDEHLRRAVTYRARRALGDLLTGPYRAF